jgi:hypothetical protein
VGIVLAGSLPTWATWPAAAVAVALNVVAETVTFSRVIDAVRAAELVRPARHTAVTGARRESLASRRHISDEPATACRSPLLAWHPVVKESKFIFVTGGVASGLGKGITTASLGRLFDRAV